MFIDLSYWNHHAKTIDFTKVKGVDFVIHKLTQGTSYLDPTALARCRKANESGIPVGYYHFATINSRNVLADARMEAAFFKRQLAKHPVTTAFNALDLEVNEIGLSAADLKLWVETFMTESGCSVLYSYSSYLKDLIRAGVTLDHKPDLWIARYSVVAPNPNDFRNLGQAKYWQYSSKGTVQGIDGNVDLNKNL